MTDGGFLIPANFFDPPKEPKKQPCLVCETPMFYPGYVGIETCPCCGAPHEYDEGTRIDPAWMRNLWQGGNIQ